MKDILIKILKLEIKRNQFLIEWWEGKSHAIDKIRILNKRILELKGDKDKMIDEGLKELNGIK